MVDLPKNIGWRLGVLDDKELLVPNKRQQVFVESRPKISGRVRAAPAGRIQPGVSNLGLSRAAGVHRRVAGDRDQPVRQHAAGSGHWPRISRVWRRGLLFAPCARWFHHDYPPAGVIRGDTSRPGLRRLTRRLALPQSKSSLEATLPSSPHRFDRSGQRAPRATPSVSTT